LRGSGSIGLRFAAIKPAHDVGADKPALEDEAVKNPEERHSEGVPVVAAPQSEIF
jgi:hypothetical protein